MNYYSGNGNRILIGHFPGNTRNSEDSIDILNEYSSYLFDKPDNVGVVCAITDDSKEHSYLLKQLGANGYGYYNSAAGKTFLWQPEKKPYFVLESLKMCKEEYAIVLDGSDVVIMNDLTNIVELFETYGKKVLFNATIWMYPHTVVDIVENREQYGQYRHLNAGCAFGKTADLIEFYEKVIDTISKSKVKVGSEQYYVRKAFDTSQDTVFFDWECKIFQCWHKQQYRYEGDKCYLL